MRLTHTQRNGALVLQGSASAQAQHKVSDKNRKLELVFVPHPEETRLPQMDRKYLRTTADCTMAHLAKYLWMNLKDTPGTSLRTAWSPLVALWCPLYPLCHHLACHHAVGELIPRTINPHPSFIMAIPVSSCPGPSPVNPGTALPDSMTLAPRPRGGSAKPLRDDELQQRARVPAGGSSQGAGLSAVHGQPL